LDRLGFQTHSDGMLRWSVLVVMMTALATAAPEESVPGYEAMIPAAVKALPEPVLKDFQGGLKMAVTTSSDEAQAHVLAGLNQLHGGWEFEASRHFAAALRLDPDCLLAHWGMAISLLAPGPETGSQRDASMDRLLVLVNSGAGNELERGYVYGLIQYYKEGPAAATDAYRKLSEKFPNDLQATMFTALFGRGGYNDLDLATPEQERSEKLLEALMLRYPDSTLLINALLTIRAEAPDLKASLPMAKKLCQLAPDYPPYFQLLGHYEWRTGHHAEAAAAFNRASELFEAWMTASKSTAMDCPGWVASEAYRSVCLASMGDFDTAFAAATSLAAKKVPMDRSGSAGGRLLLWEGKTLPARLLMARGQKGDAAKALATLPKVEEISAFREKSMAYWFVDGLRLYLDALRLIDEEKYEEATKVAESITHFGEAMTRAQESSTVGGERSFWNRSFRALEVGACELKGRLALAGSQLSHGSASIWFRSAMDRQTRSSLLLPPALLSPMALRLGDCQLALGKPEDAMAAYREALTAFPNDMNSLKGLATACTRAGKKAEAAAVKKQIEDNAAQR
jgi:tetratricopeptide (TPR) repeat protein